MLEAEQYYNARDLATRYRVHIQTIWKWKSEGFLPKAFKLGNSTTRWLGKDLIEWEREKVA